MTIIDKEKARLERGIAQREKSIKGFTGKKEFADYLKTLEKEKTELENLLKKLK